jgi:hypothetical protein
MTPPYRRVVDHEPTRRRKKLDMMLTLEGGRATLGA